MQDTMVVGIDDGKNILLCKILWGWGKFQRKIKGKRGGGGKEKEIKMHQKQGRIP